MILVNGKQQAHVDVIDRGFQYGDGLFETCAVKEGKILAWSQHKQRLQQGCEQLGIVSPPDSLLQQEAESLCENKSLAVIKIILTRGVGGRGYQPAQKNSSTRVLSLHEWPSDIYSFRESGIHSGICTFRLGHSPSLAGLKHINRLEQVLASRELQPRNLQEIVVLDFKDNVIEGSRSNIFLFIDNSLVTPDLQMAGVSGIIRNSVLNVAEEMGIATETRTIHVSELQQASNVFFCNSIMGLWPVLSIEETHYSLGDITSDLNKCLHERMLIA